MNKKSVFFKLNEYYNTHFEQVVVNSLFSAGGVKAYFERYKLKQWLARTQGIILDIGSGDDKWRKFISSQNTYITLDYVDASASSPWRVSKPDINGDGLALPLKDNCVDAVLNVCVLEHVKDPRQLIKEIARVLKPGGRLLLVGPGDITFAHGEPNVFFNLTEYAYSMLLAENNLEIAETYFPSKTFVSFAQLLYFRTVRNKIFNRHSLLKCLQIPVFLLSLVVSPFINLIALLLDAVIPFDGRGYDLYMVSAHKRVNRSVKAEF
jgi:ubiquinone/menaquinone biosynthesis C-methylase UbiE